MNKEIDFIKAIVKEAEKFINKDFTKEIKGGESDFVTNLDLEIETFLIDKLKKEYPDFDIVSEEFNNNNEVTENCFIIDPIDGTINFANNLPLWGIQIACVKNGETIASVINFPKINEFYYADKTGAYLNDNKITINEVPEKYKLLVNYRINAAIWNKGKKGYKNPPDKSNFPLIRAKNRNNKG